MAQATDSVDPMRRTLPTVVAAILLLAACGDDDSGSESSDPAAETTSDTTGDTTADDGTTFGFTVVNPISLFEQHKGELLYWERSHGHFTPLGCRIVGRELARVIVAENLLAK